MSRRSLTLLIASIGTAVAIAVSVLVPVPYVILGPGPTLNTLGKDSSGHPLITIAGHRTYPTSGHLNMVTVSYQGGRATSSTSSPRWPPGSTRRRRSCREDELCPAGTDPAADPAAGHPGDDRLAADRDRGRADRAAHPLLDQLVVAQTEPGYPAYHVLRAGDLITAVDGQQVTGQTSLSNLINAYPAGTTLTLTILRKGKTEAGPGGHQGIQRPGA